MSGRTLAERLAVIVVDYRTPLGLLKRCKKSVARCAPGALTVYHDNAAAKENLGALWRRLIAELPAERDLVLLLNPDAELTDGALEEMAAGLEYRERVGAVGPCGNVRTVQAHPNPDEMPRFVVVDDLSGFCVLLNREAYDAVLGFRTDYPLYGGDTDLFARMRRFGWAIIWASNAYVEHEGGACVQQAVLHRELESEESARKQGQRYFARHGIALPAVLELAADYVFDGGTCVVRAERDEHMMELPLRLDAAEIMYERHWGHLPDGADPPDRDKSTLIWYTQGAQLTAEQIEADAASYRFAVIFESAQSFEDRAVADLLKEHWSNVHMETLHGQRIAVCASRRQTLALTMLAKNEARTIERTIRSYQWDRVIVGIDNKTDDETEQVVKSCGVPEEDIWHYDFVTMEDLERLKAAGVPASQWDQHVGFAPLRNESMQRASGCDWMIFLDGHEFLDPKSTSVLEHILTFQAPRVRVGFVSVAHGPRTFQYTRLMRPGAVHFTEVFHNDVEGYSDATAASLTAVRIIHDRPEHVTETRRAQVKSMNTYYFEALVEEDPDNERALFYLGSAHLSTESEQIAADYWKRYVELPDRGEGVYKITYNPQKYQALLYLGVIALRRGEFAEAWEMAQRANRYDPARNEHLMLLGDVAMNMRQPDEALIWYRSASTFNVPASMMFVQRKSYGALPFVNMARSYIALGKAEPAFEALGDALKRDPHDKEAQQLLLHVQRHRGNGEHAGFGHDGDGAVEAVAGGRNLAELEEVSE
ncbi:MAG: hypothetical protein ACE5FA_02165 [Dehalococcoidia bacterium]